MSSKQIIALDVGDKRIGVAVADSAIGIAVPYDTIEVDGTEITQILELIAQDDTEKIVVGYPRNQSGETTQQTVKVEDFVARLNELDVDIVYQDESLTSVLATQQLEATGKPYKKADVDMVAASLILADYLESQR